MTRYLYYLRIAFSALCGITAVLLVVLWVRSYSVADEIHGRPRNKSFGSSFEIRADYGFIGVVGYPNLFEFLKAKQWTLERYGTGQKAYSQLVPYYDHVANGVVELFVPFWIATSVAAISAAAPWLRWHFSLRTLLLATTAIAILLGLIVWSMQ